MKWGLVALAVVIGGTVYHVLELRSQIFWEQVGPNTDKALNPSKYTQDD